MPQPYVNTNPGSPSDERQRGLTMLGVKAAGFWTNWAQRYIPVNAPEGSPSGTFANKIDPSQVKSLPTPNVAIQASAPEPVIPPVPKYQDAGLQVQPPAPGHANLPKAERELAERQAIAHRRANPFMGTSTLDEMTAESIFKDMSVVNAMKADPNKFMSKALQEYYVSPDADMWMKNKTNMTNFEIMTTEYSLLKKQNEKNIGSVSAVKGNVKNTTYLKNQQNQSKQYGQSGVLNVGKGGYQGTRMLSIFG